MSYPAPAHLHTRLIDHVHSVLGHPGFPADHKANYGKILSILLGQQAKSHAAQATPGAGPGGVQTPQDNGLEPGQITNGVRTPVPTTLGGGPSQDTYPQMGGVQYPQDTGPPEQMAAMPANPFLAALHDSPFHAAQPSALGHALIQRHFTPPVNRLLALLGR